MKENLLTFHLIPLQHPIAFTKYETTSSEKYYTTFEVSQSDINSCNLSHVYVTMLKYTYGHFISRNSEHIE